jgi:hypothetical protein
MAKRFKWATYCLAPVELDRRRERRIFSRLDEMSMVMVEQQLHHLAGLEPAYGGSAVDFSSPILPQGLTTKPAMPEGWATAWPTPCLGGGRLSIVAVHTTDHRREIGRHVGSAFTKSRRPFGRPTHPATLHGNGSISAL